MEMTGPTPEGALLTKADRENLDRAIALGRVQLTDHNRAGVPAEFGRVVSQATSARQYLDPEHLAWVSLLGLPLDIVGRFNRKVWEWTYILQAARQHGTLEPGRRAVGFGVGNEPIPAALARYGVSVIATDQSVAEDDGDWEAIGQWAQTGQLLTGIEGLMRPDIVANDRMTELVRTRRVDMNEVPDDLGPYDLAWSSCALEHLGSPELGLRFARRTAELLNPGGIAVHTTELELTDRAETADWGHLACYRPNDLRELARELASVGFEMELNFHIAMETPEDRWVSVVLLHGPELAVEELSHLKVAFQESVITSFGIIIRRPAR
jgi:hypothetical protein